LVDQARKLRNEAHSLLYEKGLLDLVQSSGPTCVTGSYSLDLMTWRDLDISVQLPDERDIPGFFNIGHRIVDRFKVARMTFNNPVLLPNFPYDRGLYLGPHMLYRGQNWKVDLWGYGKDNYQMNLHKFERLSDELRDADRLSILRIKNEVCRRPEYIHEVNSLDIYEAVAKHHIKTVKEFDEWFTHKGTAGRNLG
jgi:hypothetical protein